MNGHHEYKYFAFISYCWDDEKEAKKLQKKLEHYKLPVQLQGKYPELESHIRPIFRDKTDLNGVYLEGSLLDALAKSRFLIVLCSPRSAKRKWINDGLQYFLNNNKGEYIIPYIIEGKPRSNDVNEECFPPALLALSTKDDILGININDAGRDIAFVKLISRLLSVEFDILWDRFKIEKKKRKQTIIICALVILISFVLSIYTTYYLGRPFDLTLNLSESTPHNEYLPESNGTIVMMSGNDTLSVKEFESIGDNIQMPHIHGKYRNKEIRFVTNIFGFTSTDTLIKLNKTHTINIKRDSTYSTFAGYVVYNDDLNPAMGSTIEIENHTTECDQNGYFRIDFPIQQQTTIKHVKILDGINVTAEYDLQPQTNHKLIVLKK